MCGSCGRERELARIKRLVQDHTGCSAELASALHEISCDGPRKEEDIAAPVEKNENSLCLAHFGKKTVPSLAPETWPSIPDLQDQKRQRHCPRSTKAFWGRFGFKSKQGPWFASFWARQGNWVAWGRPFQDSPCCSGQGQNQAISNGRCFATVQENNRGQGSRKKCPQWKHQGRGQPLPFPVACRQRLQRSWQHGAASRYHWKRADASAQHAAHCLSANSWQQAAFAGHLPHTGLSCCCWPNSANGSGFRSSLQPPTAGLHNAAWLSETPWELAVVAAAPIPSSHRFAFSIN